MASTNQTRHGGSRSASPATSHSTPLTAHSLSPAADDDIWGTPPNETNFQGLQSSIPSDIPRLRTTHTTAGYRDGIATARDTAVQPGFDEGYLLGAALGMRAGYLAGLVEGLSTGGSLEHADSQARNSLPDTLQTEVKDALDELKIENLLGKEWVDEHGIWKWNVADTDEPTIHQVANSHPQIIKWTRRIEVLMAAADLERGDGMEPRSDAIQDAIST